MQAVIQKNLGATRQIAPPGLSDTSVMSTLFYVCLRFMHPLLAQAPPTPPAPLSAATAPVAPPPSAAAVAARTFVFKHPSTTGRNFQEFQRALPSANTGATSTTSGSNSAAPSSAAQPATAHTPSTSQPAVVATPSTSASTSEAAMPSRSVAPQRPCPSLPLSAPLADRVAERRRSSRPPLAVSPERATPASQRAGPGTTHSLHSFPAGALFFGESRSGARARGRDASDRYHGSNRVGGLLSEARKHVGVLAENVCVPMTAHLANVQVCCCFVYMRTSVRLCFVCVQVRSPTRLASVSRMCASTFVWPYQRTRALSSREIAAVQMPTLARLWRIMRVHTLAGLSGF